jgi:nitrogenase molybdenum-iron protein beta chain
MERAADLFFETRFKPGHFVTIADSGLALGLSRFLVNDLGLIPEAQFITDDVPNEHREWIEAAFTDSEAGIASPVIFTSDGGTIREVVRGLKFRERPLILGSTWDKVITRELQGYALSISLPVSDRLVLNRSYAGYDGGLTLAEDIYTVILNSFQ